MYPVNLNLNSVKMMRGWPRGSPRPGGLQHPVHPESNPMDTRHMIENIVVGHNILPNMNMIENMAVGHNILPNMENQYRIDENYSHRLNYNEYDTRVGTKHTGVAMNPVQTMRNIRNARDCSVAEMQHTGTVDIRSRQYHHQVSPRGGGSISVRALDSSIRQTRDPNLPEAFRPVNTAKPLLHFVVRPMDNMRSNGKGPSDSDMKYIIHSTSANNVMMLPDNNMRNMENLPGSNERTSRRDIELRTLRLDSKNPRQTGHGVRSRPAETIVRPMDGNARQANVTQPMQNRSLPPDIMHLESVLHLDPIRPVETSAQSMGNVRSAEDSLMRGIMSHSLQAQNTMKAAVEEARDNPRDARNKAEKQRRDKLNGSINELASLVPLVAESSRKIDKTGVLRLTAHDLRKEHVFGNSISPCHLNMKPKLVEAFIDMMGGCLLTTTCRGIIVVISANVEHYLGHLQTDLLGMNILNLCHPEDLEKLKTNLMPHATPMGPNGQLLITDMDSNIFTANEKPRQFQVRLARAVQRSEVPQYEICRFNGSLRFADRANASGASTGQIVRRHRARGDEAISPSGNDVVFIGMIHILKQTILSERLIEASKQEYRTRHLIDGRIVQCDQRISVVAGYLTSEISGVSAFTFMHKEDVRFVIIALRQMYDRSKQYGESCYRLMSRTGEFIYLRTTGYLEISSDNAVQSFVCMNSRIPEEKGRELIEDMKEKYSVIFNGVDENFPYGSSGESTVEDPQKLEQVIMHLITNLPSSNSQHFPSPDPSAPLSIIPPKRCTIKSSIAKSVSVISQAIKMKGSDSGSIVKPGFKPESMYTPSELMALKTSHISSIEHKNKILFPTNPEKRIAMKEEIILNKESLIQRNLLSSEGSPEETISNKNCPDEMINVKKELPQTTAINPFKMSAKISVEDVHLPTSSSKVYHTFPSDLKPIFPQIYINNESFTLPPALNQRTVESMLETPIMALNTQQTSEKAIAEMMPDLNSYVNSVYGMNIFVPNTGNLTDKDNLETVDCEDLLIDSDMKPESMSSADVLLSSLNVLDPGDHSFCLPETLASTSSYVGNLSQLKRSHNSETEFDTIPKRRMQSSSPARTGISSESDSLINTPTKIHHDRQSQEGLDCYIQQLSDPNSDLDILVPRSLAALESSITLIDGTVHELTQFENMPHTTITDILMEHQAHKELLESIQLDHRNRLSDGSPTDDEPSPAPCLDN